MNDNPILTRSSGTVLPVLFLCLASLLTVSFCGCGPADRDGDLGDVEIEFWTIALGDAFADYINDMIERYEAEHPGVRVKWVDVSGGEVKVTRSSASFGDGENVTDSVLVVNENNCANPTPAQAFGCAANPFYQDPQHGTLAAANRLEWNQVSFPIPGASNNGTTLVTNCIGKIGIVALHPLDEGDTHARGQIGVFAICFLAPAPARIAKNVDIGRPSVEPGADAAQMAGLAAERMKGLDFGADDGRNRVDQWRVEGGGQPDRFGEVGGWHRADRAMERFRPPIIGWYAKTRNGGRGVEQLLGFFLKSQ